MDTIRLTYSPHGYGRFLRLVSADVPTDEGVADGEESGQTTQTSYQVKTDGEDEETP